MPRDAAAEELWREVYCDLEAERPGLCGSLLARAAPHVNRLSLVYALSERAERIGGRHLTAAVAAWEFCERSARHLFGDSTGDRPADDVLTLLRNGPGGVNRNDIRDYFGRNVSSERLSVAPGTLLRLGRARAEQVPTGGRPAERWFAAGGRR